MGIGTTGAAKYPTMSRTVPTTKNYLASNVSSAKAENVYSAFYLKAAFQ